MKQQVSFVEWHLLCIAIGSRLKRLPKTIYSITVKLCSCTKVLLK